MLSLDQLTKHWALASLGAVGATIELAGPINLTPVVNRSTAFGLIAFYGEFSRWALTALGLAATEGQESRRSGASTPFLLKSGIDCHSDGAKQSPY
jgi:hypothetical protein